MAPLKKWKKKDILAMVPESVKVKFSLEAYPECVLQELFLVERAVIPNLFGEADVLYSMDLTDAAKICRVDISRVYEPYKKQQEAEKRKREAEWAKEEKKKEEKKPKEKQQKQEKLFEEDPMFSASDPVLYIAKIEYYKTYYNESIKRVVYMDKPTAADAVIFAGMIYLGGWKPQNKKVTSKGVKVLWSQPSTLYDAPEPYKGIISQHPEIEERMAAQKAKERKQKEKEKKETARYLQGIWRGAAKRAEAKRKAEEKAKKAAEREEKKRLKEEEKARKAAEREARKTEKENKKSEE
ncbi:MAG: hypothetical protein IJI41_12940 [Anaerolineaceae bacterium]|nr:hypothetical protein [Anaerolineaceae bacterium]